MKSIQINQVSHTAFSVVGEGSHLLAKSLSSTFHYLRKKRQLFIQQVLLEHLSSIQYLVLSLATMK